VKELFNISQTLKKPTSLDDPVSMLQTYILLRKVIRR